MKIITAYIRPVVFENMALYLCLRRKAALTCFIAVLFVPCVARGQSEASSQAIDTTSSEERWLPAPQSIGTNALNIARTPLTLASLNRFLIAGTSGLVLGVLVHADSPVHRGLSANESVGRDVTGPLAGPGRLYDRIGPDRAIFGTAGLLAAGGLALQDRSLTRTSVRIVESLLYTNLTVGALKSVIGRARPVAGEGPRSVELGELERDHNELSMPSGHTARAFAFASVLACQADRWYVSVPAYGMATSVGLERIRSGDHWMTDVVVGGVLGYLIGRSVTTGPISLDGLSITPHASPGQFGLSIRF